MNAEEIAKRIAVIKENIHGGVAKEAATVALAVFRLRHNELCSEAQKWSTEGKLPAGELMFVLVMGLCESIGADDTELYMISLIRETCRLFRSYAPVDKLPS